MIDLCYVRFAADAYPDFGDEIAMACESVTVELRGERAVSDQLAITDARALFRFLQRRDYIAQDISNTLTESDKGEGEGDVNEDEGDALSSSLEKVSAWGYTSLEEEDAAHRNRKTLLREASALVTTDLLMAPKGGIVVWAEGTQAGDIVTKGQLLGEIVDIVVRTWYIAFCMFGGGW